MTGLAERVGRAAFIQIVIECWNEVFIALLLIIVLFEMHDYRNTRYGIHLDISISKKLVIFYATVMLYDLCSILTGVFSGAQGGGADTALKLTAVCTCAVSAFHNIFIMQIFKVYFADRLGLWRIRRAVAVFQGTEAVLCILLMLADLICDSSGRELAHLIWQGTAFVIFLFIGIVTMSERKQINHPISELILIIDAFPLIGSFEMLFFSTDHSGKVLCVMALMVFLIYEKNKTEFIIGSMYELEKAKTQLAENRLSLEQSNNEALLAQIQPHFINNSLMAISARCVDYSDVYENISNFSLYLRSHFEAVRDTRLISFEREMTNIEAYLALEQLRYKDRLNVELEIECDDFFIPALSVQPLAEIAVRKGIGSYSDGGSVRIATDRVGGEVRIDISYFGEGERNEPDIGAKEAAAALENAKARLSLIGGRLEIIRGENGVTASVTIDTDGGEGI